MKIVRVVTEYQAEILVDNNGRQLVASFPEGVTKAVPYGGDLKAHAVYIPNQPETAGFSFWKLSLILLGKSGEMVFHG
ncbi:MAG: hypothetical protein HW406_1604 [Candidatus Brocadiaceae bacterium]|nr:hypothetical protein [Candidatus Brocadiaceae bacterium]